MTPEFHPLADAELTDAASFYEGSAAGLGVDFLAEMERLVALVCVYPDVGREYPDAIRTVSARRFPYTLVYQVFGQRIFILAVAHQRRAPRYWAGRIG
jgi:plasmid stabilization system protein ParE